MKELEQKAWYRAIKVLYIGLYILVMGIVVFILNSGGVCGNHFSDTGDWIYDQCSVSTWAITLLVIVGVFKLIKRAFLYIAIGKSRH
jgi:hypothetical protein